MSPNLPSYDYGDEYELQVNEFATIEEAKQYFYSMVIIPSGITILTKDLLTELAQGSTITIDEQGNPYPIIIMKK